MIDRGNYYQWYTKGLLEHDTRAWKSEKVCETLCTRGGTKVAFNEGLKIRKLTPRECLRLMGVRELDIDNMMINQSDASLYHLAGDSIVVNVLMAIFREML